MRGQKSVSSNSDQEKPRINSHFLQRFVFCHCLFRRKQKIISFVKYWSPGNIVNRRKTHFLTIDRFLFCFYTLFDVSVIYNWQTVDDGFLIDCELLTGVFFFLYFFELQASFSLSFYAFKSFLRGFVPCFAVYMSYNLGHSGPFSRRTNCRLWIGNDYNDAKHVNGNIIYHLELHCVRKKSPG